MSDAATSTPLKIVGEPSASVCEGDFCEIPENHTQAIVNRRVDFGDI